MRLKENQVPALRRLLAAEEMIEAGFEDLCSRSIAGDVTAEFAVRAIGAHYHRERIPAHQGGNPLFEFHISRVNRLLVQGDRVSIRRIWRRRSCDSKIARMFF